MKLVHVINDDARLQDGLNIVRSGGMLDRIHLCFYIPMPWKDEFSYDWGRTVKREFVAYFFRIDWVRRKPWKLGGEFFMREGVSWS